MKVLIIYDSVYGNTEKIAQAMKQTLEGNEVRVCKVADADPEGFKSVHLLIVGSPTHGGRPTPAMKRFLKQIPTNGLQGVHAAAFDTGIPRQGQGVFLKLVISVLGYAAKHIASALQKRGATILKEETFYVTGKEGPIQEGEIDRAQTWARALLQNPR